jgi:hypothetical protein
MERMFSLFGFYPYRCESCDTRFFRFGFNSRGSRQVRAS